MSSIDPDEQAPYTVETGGDQFKVVDWEGGVLLVCRDPSSAGQYAALMNAAFGRGFKAGLHKARLK